MSHHQLFLLYLPITALLPALLCWYVGYHLLGPRRGSRPWAYATIGVMSLLGIAASLSLILWSEQDRAPIRPLVTAGFHSLGYLLAAAALLGGRDALRLGVWLVTRRGGLGLSRGSDPRGRKRSFGLYGSSWLMLATAGVCTWWGHELALLPPAVHELTIPIRQLPGAFDGYRIAHLTDIHYHGRGDVERIQQLVDEVNRLDVDLIAITGDVVDGPLDDLRRDLRVFGALRARDGVYVAVGNHENYADVDACVEEFRRLGFQVLLNQHRVVEHGLDRLVIAGVTNPRRGLHGARYTALQGTVAQMQSDPRVALGGAPLGAPRLLLAHQPKSVRDARGLGVDLALAGHTHGGQFFPWNYAARLIFPYTAGLYRDGSMQVYVSRGIGTFGPRLRLGSAPEIPVLTLRLGD